MVIVDLAGSNSGSAITAQFAHKSHPKALAARMGEKDAVNWSLVGLKQCLRKYRTGSGLLNQRNEGNIRALLVPFLNAPENLKPQIRIMCTLSPSLTSVRESRNTLRAARVMSKCAMIPERCAWRAQHIDDERDKFRFMVRKIQRQLAALKTLQVAQPEQQVALESVMDDVRKSIQIKHSLDEPSLFATSQFIWSARDTLQLDAERQSWTTLDTLGLEQDASEERARREGAPGVERVLQPTSRGPGCFADGGRD